MNPNASPELCACGNPFRDYDNRCLRCKKQINESRAQKLSFHRKISEIPLCKCSETTIESWGKRKTLIEDLVLCNFCDSKFSNSLEDVEDVAAKQLALQREKELKIQLLKIDEEVSRIVAEVKNGNSMYLYCSYYVSIDSYNNFGGKISHAATFNDAQIKQAGAQGWRVVQSIPRTAGETLENYEGFGKTWAGGIGGTVVGAYVIMEFLVTVLNVDTSVDLIRDTVRNYLDL